MKSVFLTVLVLFFSVIFSCKKDVEYTIPCDDTKTSSRPIHPSVANVSKIPCAIDSIKYLGTMANGYKLVYKKDQSIYEWQSPFEVFQHSYNEAGSIERATLYNTQGFAYKSTIYDYADNPKKQIRNIIIQEYDYKKQALELVFRYRFEYDAQGRIVEIHEISEQNILENRIVLLWKNDNISQVKTYNLYDSLISEQEIKYDLASNSLLKEIAPPHMAFYDFSLQENMDVFYLYLSKNIFTGIADKAGNLQKSIHYRFNEKGLPTTIYFQNYVDNTAKEPIESFSIGAGNGKNIWLKFVYRCLNFGR